jgi:hypothetical protein
VNIIPFPQRQLTSEQWIQKNPEVFFVASEQCLRRCSLCRKSIPVGQEFFGGYEVKVDLFIRTGCISDVTINRQKVVHRLHPKCALELEGRVAKRSRHM